MTDQQAAEARELLSDVNLDATRETLAAWVDEYPQLRGLLRTWDALSARLAQAEQERDGYLARVDEVNVERQRQEVRAIEAEARLRKYEAALTRAVYLAEHLFQMVPRDVWRDSGGDDGQGHYEGDYRAEKLSDELADLASKAETDG